MALPLWCSSSLPFPAPRALFYLNGHDIFVSSIPLTYWVALLLQTLLTVSVVVLFGFVLPDRSQTITTVVSQSSEPTTQRKTCFFLGVVLALLGQFYTTEHPWIAIVFFTAGALLVSPALRAVLAGSNNGALEKFQNERLLLFLFFLLALILRFARNGDIYPPGVEMDEYIWIENYLRVMAGQGSPFGTGKFGIPTLQGSVTAFFTAIWGISAITIRGWSIITGSLMIFPAYYVAKTLFRPKIALIFVVLLATCPYPLFYGRIISGSRLLFNCFSSLAFLTYAFRTAGIKSAFAGLLAGTFLGFGLNDYFACRVMPILVSILFIGFVLKEPREARLRASIRVGLSALIGFAVGIAPLAWHFYQNSGPFLARMKGESMLHVFISGDSSAIFRQVGPLFKMFLVTATEGRRAWFSNPVVIPFPPPLAACFAVSFLGLFVANPRLALSLSVALIGSLLPTMLSSLPPDSHRAILSIIPSHMYTAILVGTGWELITSGMRMGRSSIGKFLALGVCIALPVFLNLHYIAGVTQLSGSFHSDWKIKLEIIREILPTENIEVHGSTPVIRNTTLYTDGKPFFALHLLYPQMKFSRFEETILETGLSEGTSLFCVSDPTASFGSQLAHKYPEAVIRRLSIRGRDHLIARVNVRSPSSGSREDHG